MGKLVVGDILKTAALRFRDREAFYCSATERRLSFGQVNQRCNRLAHGLTALGLRKGEVVAFLSTNRVEMVEIFFALAKTGLIGIPLNYRLARSDLLALMQSLNARALICEAGFQELATEAEQALPLLSHIVMMGASEGGEGPSVNTVDYEALLASSSVDEPQVEIEEADPFYFNLTSGTSGLPKCYVLTHYNNATVWNMFHAMDLGSSDVILTVFPMFGRVGFVWCVAGMIYGIRNVLASFDPERVLQLIESEKISITNLVPTMAALLLDHGELDRRDLSSLRALVFAGSVLPGPMRQEIADRIGTPLYEYYGMQETSTLVVSTPQDRLNRPDSVGQPILHADVRIVDERGRVLPPNELGEIIGRSPSSVTAYHDNPGKSAETFRDGWVFTGDLGMLDDEGYLYIRGRKKDVIVTGGQNVFAAEVEEVILSNSDVRECAVIGLPDDLWGERVTAVVVLHAGASATPESIIDHCREGLAGFKAPKHVILRTQPLPTTPTGKVQKFVLVDQYGAQP